MKGPRRLHLWLLVALFLIIAGNGWAEEVREERLARIQIRLPVDLNRTRAEELSELPFIGPARAFAILEERERRRRFQYVEELKEVIGIGPIIFDAIKDLVTVGQP